MWKGCGGDGAGFKIPNDGGRWTEDGVWVPAGRKVLEHGGRAIRLPFSLRH